MSTDVEELLRDGMDRFTTGIQAPSGLARATLRLRRRRLIIRSAVLGGTVVGAVTLVVAMGKVSGNPRGRFLART